jgi:ubiquitin carboxyl-terminal hydrolase 8
MTDFNDDGSSDKFEKTLFYKKGLCGLSNLGNTCFMNSIIQCLNSNRDFTKIFLSDSYKEDLNTDKIEHNLVEQWTMLSKGLYKKNCVITPSSFHRCVQILSLHKGLGQFSGFGQNDSQEFLQFFLENIHNAISKEVIMSINGVPQNNMDKTAIKALNAWKLFFKNDYSKIVEMFYGQLISVITTEEDSKFRSESYDPFSNLSLEIPNMEKISIYDCLNNFTKKESLDEFSQDKDDTKKYKKKIVFWQTPETLVIFFKRFSNNGMKKNVFIDFPLEGLDLSKYSVGYDKSSCIFDLHAVSNHEGGTMGGHYWAYTKNYDGIWYKFNDKYVSLKNTEDVVTPNAYCLFYKKRV